MISQLPGPLYGGKNNGAIIYINTKRAMDIHFNRKDIFSRFSVVPDEIVFCVAKMSMQDTSLLTRRTQRDVVTSAD